MISSFCIEVDSEGDEGEGEAGDVGNAEEVREDDDGGEEEDKGEVEEDEVPGA